MSVIVSQLESTSASYSANHAAMSAMVDEFRAVEECARKKALSKEEQFRKRKKLLPLERLDLLLDRGAPFLELMSLAGYRMHDDKDGSGAGGGLIAGIGYVEGTRCLVVVNNCAIKGGTISPAGLEKSLRLQTIAMENRLPVVTLAESGGANLNYATEVFVDGARTFANQARLSAAGIPQITVVHGNATAGGAYQPGLSDYVVMVRGKSKMFLAGPPLVKAATGEVASDEELGGGELHTGVVGTGEYLAEDDADGVRIAREIVRMLRWRDGASQQGRRESRAPRYPGEELLGVVPVDGRVPYDAREIIARLVDDSEFLEFKGELDQQTLCGHASIEGHGCGVLANNGPITPAGSAKAAQFIQLCDQSRTPVIFLQNTTGFMVGTDAERGGIIKHGAKMIQAVANARVPMVTILVGGSYGAGNYAMCGRGLDPRFLFAWPNSRVAVMGGEQAGKVLRIVTEQKCARQGVEPDPAMLDAMEQHTVNKITEESTALFGTARIWDDGILDPRDTRRVLGFVLDICKEEERRVLHPNSFGVARL